MNILLAVDGSEIALTAVDTLIKHARLWREPPQVHLLFVHPPLPIGLPLSASSHASLDDYYLEEGLKLLARPRQLLEAAGLPVTAHVHVGEAAASIVKRATELDCDLICMSSHGRGALPNAILGSVASKVLHLSRVPVLIAR